MTPSGADGDLFLMTAAVFAGVAMVVAALLLVFAGEGSSRARRLGRRLEALRKRGEAAGRAARPAPGASSSIKLSESKSRIPGAEWLGRLMPRREMLTRRFSRTGFRISLGTYALASVAVAALSTFVEIEFMRMPLAVGVIGGIGAGIGIPHGFVSYLIGRRTRKFLAYFPEAIELIVRGIKSGLPISEEINAVGREIADPVGYEFRQVADGLLLGQTMEESMWDAAKRLDIADFNFFVISLSVQRETGGNLAETLENLSDVLRKRRQMKLKVHAMSSEARASAMIIGSLPFIMLGILVIMAPAYVGMLFTDPRGQMVTIGAALLMVCGVLVMAKMVRFEI